MMQLKNKQIISKKKNIRGQIPVNICSCNERTTELVSLQKDEKFYGPIVISSTFPQEATTTN